MLMRALCLFVFLCSVPIQIPAHVPAWWTDPETRIIEDLDEPIEVSENHAPVNLGQLKHVALQAQAHLEERLTAGAGFSIGDLWPDIPAEENYAPVNVGQLKAVANPFYDRLIEAGYDTRKNLIDRGYPADWSFDLPWPPDTPPRQNYGPANIGQLKLVFSFDLTDFDDEGEPENPLPEWWQLAYFGTTGVDPNADFDNDGQSNFQEFLAGTDPTRPDHPDVALQLFKSNP